MAYLKHVWLVWLECESYHYPYVLTLFREQFLAGHLYPRWMPALMGGYGSPCFLLFSTGFWFFALPFFPAYSKPTSFAVKLALWVMAFMAGIGMAYRPGALFLHPYQRTDSHMCILPDTMAYACTLPRRRPRPADGPTWLCPWMFYHLICMSDRLRRDKHCFSPLQLWLGLIGYRPSAYTYTPIAVCMAAILTLSLPFYAFASRTPLRALTICDRSDDSHPHPYHAPIGFRAFIFKDLIAYQKAWNCRYPAPYQLPAIPPRHSFSCRQRETCLPVSAGSRNA